MLAILTVTLPASPQYSQKNREVKKSVLATEAGTGQNKGKQPKLKMQPVREPNRGLRSPLPMLPASSVSPAGMPARAAGDMPTMYGSVIYSDATNAGTAEVGLYEIPTSANAEGLLIVPGAKANGGGVYVDDVYYCTSYMSLMGITLVTISGYNVATAEQLFTFSTMDLDALFMGQVYDPTTDAIYGIGYNKDGSSYQLAKVVYDASSITVTAVGNLPGRWNTLMVDGSGQLWAISYDLDVQKNVVTGSKLCKINKLTAEVTEIGDTGLLPEYRSGGVIDTRSGRMFWNVCPIDGSGWMCEVNMETGKASKLFRFRNNDEILGMYIPTAGIPNEAPAECTDVQVNFPGGGLKGTVTLTTPSTLYDGKAGTGNLSVSVYASGEEAGTQTAGWGERLTFDIDMTDYGAGLYDFSACASNSAGAGPLTKVKGVYVGADVPEATTATVEYVNGVMNVSWLPVSTAVNGGYMDLSSLTYTVKDRDGKVLSEGLKTTTFSETVSVPESFTCYGYIVEVVCNGLVSEPAYTNLIALGDIIPPYTSDFGRDEFAGWTLIDGNKDGKTWYFEDGLAKVSYNESVAVDDWLITPAVKLSADKAYWLSFATWSSSVWPEKLEVKIGKSATAEAMQTVLIEPTVVNVDEEEPMNLSCKIDVDSDGLYYIGFHGISDPDQFILYLDNITISEGLVTSAPAMPANLRVQNDMNGEKKATISFTTPDKNIDGGALSSLTKVEVARDGEVVKTFDVVKPAENLSYTDNVPANGEYTYSVTAYNAAGKGMTASVTVYVGCDRPLTPTGVTMKRTANTGEVSVEWTPVTRDINGTPFPAGAVTYNVARDVDNEWQIIAEGVSGTTYTFQAVESGEQEFVQCAVFAVSEIGSSDGTTSNMIPAGTPYDGLDETFDASGLKYIWGISSRGDMTISINGPEDIEGINGVDGDGGYVAFEGTDITASAMLYSGLVSTEGIDNPGLTFYVYNIVSGNTPDINYVDVKVQTNASQEWVTIASVTMNEAGGNVPGWHKVTVPLSRVGEKEFQIGIEAFCKQWSYTLVDNIEVASVLPVDLRVAGITAPSRVKTGAEYGIEVTVANDGTSDADAFAVELYADNELVGTEYESGLASGVKTNVVFERVMPAIATEPVNYYAKVVYAADQNADNDRSQTIAVEPIVSKLPAPKNLSGASRDGAVQLTWNRPVLDENDGKSVTYDFEDADAFADRYGDWIFYDGDESPVGGVSGTTLPGIQPSVTKGSFWIWDSDVVPGNETFDAHSGTKYLFSLFRYDDGPVDDWAISPELYGDAQTITFYAKSYDPSYPEAIEVYSSKGSTDVADFEYVRGSRVGTVPSDWTLYKVKLPAGTRRFAIRSYATGSFMLMVDDVTFIPASNADLEVVGYNVYRDGLKINSDLVEISEYTDTNVVDGEHYSYVVTAVYAEEGESAGSNVAEVTFDINSVHGPGAGNLTITAGENVISVRNAEGCKVLVTGADGALIYSGEGSAETLIPATRGVYVVKAGKTAVKVLVK